jgi:hypothetical protein
MDFIMQPSNLNITGITNSVSQLVWFLTLFNFSDIAYNQLDGVKVFA